MATKKAWLCFAYIILVKTSSKSTSDSYHLQFEYGYCKGEVEKRGVKDHYNPNINTVTADDFLEHIKKIYDDSIGMIR